MSLTSSEMSAADLAAITGNSRSNGGFGNDSGAWWLLVLLLFAMNGGWGNNGNNGGGNNGGGGTYGAGALYPWMNQSDNINGGFRDQMLNNNITSIRDGIYGLSNQLCNCCGNMQMSMANGFAGVNSSINGAQNAIAQQLYGNQIADMQQAFAMQQAMNSGFNGLQSQLADCCCKNQLATVQTQNIVQNEGNMTRFADANNTRDLLENQTRNTQAILDKLCQLELDGVKGQLSQAQRENVGLQNQLNMATMREGMTAQNALFQQGLNNEVDALYNRLSNCPVPTTPVYGRTPIFTCNNNNNGGCGCGCGCGGMA